MVELGTGCRVTATAPAGRYHSGRRLGWRDGLWAGIALVPLLLAAAVSLVIVSLVNAGPTGRRGCAQAVVMGHGEPGMRSTPSKVVGTSSAAGLGGASCRSASSQPAIGTR